MAGTLIKIACVVVACMLVFAPHANAITCGQVTGNLMSCLPYLRSKGPLTPACCGGVKSLNSAARTPADKRTACGCIKSVSGTVQGIDAGLAAGLPGKCGVNIPYKISPNTDCNKIQ